MKSLISQLSGDYPAFQFKTADRFRWSAKQKTIFINLDTVNSQAFLLHELSHAVLGHSEYSRDIELLRYERDAWEYATSVLAQQYQTPISDDLVQDNLDTYRDWLHARSTCPNCQATGLQVQEHVYSCVACGTRWQVNEAKMCGLKRYTHKTKIRP